MCCHDSKHHCDCDETPSHQHRDCCCCEKDHSDPAFWNREEKIAWLEQQRGELQETSVLHDHRSVVERASRADLVSKALAL